MTRREVTQDGHNATPPLATEDRLRLILQNITDYAIFTLDAQGFVTEWPEGAQRVKGWTPEEIIGQHVSMFYTPEQIAAGTVDKELKQAAETGRAEREDWRVRKGGERFWGNEIATAMRDANGGLIGFTKIARDLSKRKQLEDSLRENEERYRMLVDNARDFAIFMTDPAGCVMTWNTGAQRIFGYAEAEIVGKDGGIFYTTEDRASGEYQKELATAVGEGRASDDRWQVRKGGEKFFASGITTPLRNTGGTLRGFVKICRDLTERRTLEVQRERLLEQEKVARLEAERAMTLRDEFLAVVSHELRTPLTAILLWAKILRNGQANEEDFEMALETIEKSADAQRQVIEDLLDVSRMISGKFTLKFRETELVPVIQAAVYAVQPMAEAKGVSIELSLDERAGAVRADPDRVQQIIWNLLNNAVKFTDPGGRVSINLYRLDSFLQIQVADTGQGISPQFLPHIFERFRQADATTTRAQGGLGLGLSIAHQLVELHGGTIEAQSPGAGKGTTFTVRLPLAQIHATAAAGIRHNSAAPPSANPPFQPAPLLKSLRVLLVEDEPNTRTAIKRLLEDCEAEVTAVESAALAVAAFREGLSNRRFDLLVSDIGMPVQDGYDLIREIRQMEQQRGERSVVPAVALTAYTRDEDRARASTAGFQLHISKPIEPAELISTVVSVIRSSAKNRN